MLLQAAVKRTTTTLASVLFAAATSGCSDIMCILRCSNQCYTAATRSVVVTALSVLSKTTVQQPLLEASH
jgi:hypothetical protein